MIVGVPVEVEGEESRVALVPPVLPLLAKIGLEVVLEKGAGEKAGIPDQAYQEQGARLAADRKELFSTADVILTLHGPSESAHGGASDLEWMRRGQIALGLLNPFGRPEAIRRLAETGTTVFALELLPRISRAQPMDALTSMAMVAGYKAVLLAASALIKMFPMMITAAGTITPARVLVIGAGVAGLQAIASARRLGAVVQAYDVRSAVKEQVESLGARFLELGLESAEAEAAGGYARALGEEFYQKQRELMKQAVAGSDVVISTAAVPGQQAPRLITEDTVREMRPGAVIIDLAAEWGGNCELTRPGETVKAHGVTIVGPLNLASTVPYHASQMYARNVTAFLENLFRDGRPHLNLEDPIVRDTLVAHGGEVVNVRVRELLGLSAVGTSPGERSHS